MYVNVGSVHCVFLPHKMYTGKGRVHFASELTSQQTTCLGSAHCVLCVLIKLVFVIMWTDIGSVRYYVY